MKSHSDVPERDEDWPALDEVLAFRDRVRSRLMALYDDLDAGRRRISRRIARVLQMTLEHEGFHIEASLGFACHRPTDWLIPERNRLCFTCSSSAQELGRFRRRASRDLPAPSSSVGGRPSLPPLVRP